MTAALVLALLAASADPIPAAAAAESAASKASPAPARLFRVTGRSLAEVYVDAGHVHGLARGERLRVVREGAMLAELEVTRTEPERAVCRVVSQVRPVSTGDTVTRIQPLGSPPAASPAKAAGQSAPAQSAAADGHASMGNSPKPNVAVPTSSKPPVTAPIAATSTPSASTRPLAAMAVTPPAPAPPSTERRTATPSPAAQPLPTQPTATAVRTPDPKATIPAAPETARPVAADKTTAPTPSTTSAAPSRASTTAGDGKSFSVRYRSASSVYLEGGRAQGLSVGDKLQAMAGNTPFADLEVLYVAEQSASCRVVSETRPIKAGDSVVRVSRAIAVPTPAAVAVPAAGAAPAPVQASPVPQVAATTEPASAKSRAPAAPWARVRGSVSAGYYQSSDKTGTGLGYNERTARLDLTVSEIDGRPLSFTLRGRSRQDVRDRRLSDWTPESERSDRLYEVALRYEPPSDRYAVEAGRIGLYRFVGIGYLDGALARYRPTRILNLGVFGGRAAEIEGLGFNGTGAKYGAFLQLAPGGRYSTTGYDALLAFVRENADGDVSRQYLSLESRFSGGGRWSLFERAEVDLNSGWRQEATGKSLQLSNVSLSGNLRLASTAWAFVAYDGRRNYRYYQNRLVPEEVFDDLLHQGLRGGLNYSKPGGFGASAGFGMSLKEPDPRHPELNVANAYSFNAGLRHANLRGLSLGIDGSGFWNGYADGAVVSARAGHRFRAGHLLDLSYGRSFYHVSATEEDRATQWLRLNGRFELGRHAYLSGDLEYDKGDDLEGPRGLVEAGWIF